MQYIHANMLSQCSQIYHVNNENNLIYQLILIENHILHFTNQYYQYFIIYFRQNMGEI